MIQEVKNDLICRTYGRFGSLMFVGLGLLLLSPSIYAKTVHPSCHSDPYGGTVSCSAPATPDQPAVSETPSYDGSYEVSVYNSDPYSWIVWNTGAISPGDWSDAWARLSETGKATGQYSYSAKRCIYDGHRDICSTWSPSKTVTVVITPGMPGSIDVPTSPSGGDFPVDWGATSGTVTAYDLDRQYNGGPAWLNVYDGTARTTQVSGLSAGSHVFRVRACNTLGGYTSCSGFRTSSTVTVAIPAAVPSLTVPSVNDNSDYDVSWDPVANTTYYTLQEKIGSNGWTNVPLANPDDTGKSFSHTSNIYRYRASACNNVGCTVYSSEAVLTVVIAPGVPASITVPASALGGEVPVSWGVSSGTVTAYDLDRQYNGGPAWSNVYDGTSRTAQVSGLSAGSHVFRVRGCNTVGSYTRCSGFRTASAVNMGADIGYRYDALGRLTRVDENQVTRTGYCYDKAGNRYHVVQGGADCPDEPPSEVPTGLNVVWQTGPSWSISWNPVVGASGYTLRLNNGTQMSLGSQTTHATTQPGPGEDPNLSYPTWVQACFPDSHCGAKAYF